LAVLIYKNVMPQDFAALHRQEGVLSQVLGGYQQYVSKIEGEIRTAISAVEADLETGEAQALRDKAELRRVYAMAIIERVPNHYYMFRIPGANPTLGQLTEGDALEVILAAKSVTISSPNQYGNTALDIRDVESSVDPTRSLEERKADIDFKSTKFRQKSEKR